MSIFQNLIEIDSRPQWKDDVPKELQWMAHHALYVATDHTSYENAEMWAKWSIELTNRAVKEDVAYCAKQLQEDYMLANENVRQYASRMSDANNFTAIEATHSLLENLLDGTEEQTLKKIKVSGESASLTDEDSVFAKLLAGRALIFFDIAATQWSLGNQEAFLDALYSAVDASSESVSCYAWKLGEHGSNRSEFGRKGGHAKSNKYKPLRDRACELVRQRKSKSRRNAAKIIAPEILSLAKSLGIGLSNSQAESTITGWLKDAGLPANI